MMVLGRAIRRAAQTILRNAPLQVALFFLPLVWIGYFAITSSERADAVEQARSHGDSVAELFEENTERIFERVDQSLLVVRALYAQDPLTFSLKSWSDKARIATGDVVQFALIGSDGYMIETTAGYSGPPLYLGDREHFISVTAQADDRLYVAKPVLGRASNKWTIQLARKLFDLARNPAGVVVGSISVDVVGKFYDTAKLGVGGTLVLRNANYVVLAARGVDQGSVLGQRAPSRVERELGDGFYVQYWNENRPNRSDRLITARRSRAFPLIFTVGISEQEIYSRSAFRQKVYLGGALLLTFIILAATTFHWRRQQALDRAHRERRDLASKFEDALRNLPQGLSMFDGRDRLIAFNRQWLELYGLLPEDIRIGMHFRDVFAKQTAVLDVEAYLVDLKNRLAGSEQISNTVQFPDGRVVYISYGRREGGGWVATHEDITERKASADRIERLAHYDSLTGLANRNLFKERIDEALARLRRPEPAFAVLLLDLDKFKSVNDALGHQCGDALLKQVADRIKAQIRDADTAARIGGDEFAVIVAATRDGAASLAERLIQAIAEPYDIDGHPVVIGCSIGLALVPEHGTRVDEILRNADLALYRSKNAGRSCFHLYSAELKAEADQRNVLEIELREAIWRDEMEVFYQPVIELGTGRVKSVEALARWHHRTRGYIPPAEFIAVAEAGGLIVELGNQVLARACRDAMSMPADVKVAVNLSALQFASTNLVDTVAFALAQSGLPQTRLELEITESVFLADTEENLKTLQRLKALGVSIALDDFGVGYSSLSYLTAFPFDKVKIDKSFIDRIDRCETVAVLKSIVQLAKTLKLSIVAEGIEASEQVKRLQSLGIPLGQGFHFSKPVPLAGLSWQAPPARRKRRAA
ncbi:EAL domain-containing protein [Bradyrhizobium daqingense]|uniref:PAS domain S-box-containing protein/diguanylate cyclase (GGDEF)-like protein n=1 Tax=Bradyrhizobium daqingense TaxID=993502 RepID=A0A562KU47_9BRAD|nr:MULTISPECIES: EAL domain-containing protein [Bradyrhizobium]MDQ8731172.1 EAL domain-containing protein [Bradyrhizobium sp. LHD-71]TWH98941.1 PAS domain S-box-containing protein/diguanylate cyclase (GGDEF)-like protein [Bradyrhizobium daqingense]UFS90790.1 EAL domain-containing protein [Bradyrhizobium daqingense]